MHDRRVSKADLHVHSKYSDRPSEWFLRRIGAPECFVEPSEVYRRARQRGMEFVTITDHNRIQGALEIADLPNTFISVEATTYFPENGCKIHLLVLGIGEEQFRTIQELRANIYQLQHYLREERILCSVSHPLFRVNGRLTIDDVEKLILMFPRFEEINGARDPRNADLAGAVFRHLTPELLAKMADRHGLEPWGPEPWKKTFTGGSDDHSGAYIGAAYTATPLAEDVGEFLAHLHRGDHEPGGCCGGSVAMGHGLYHIAYSYYKDRILRGGAGGKPTLIGELFKKLLEGSGERQPAGIGHSLRGMATRLVWSRQLNKLSEMERLIVEDFSRLFSGSQTQGTAQPPLDDRRTFHIACQISHALGYGFLCRFVDFARQGRLMESLQTVASLAPVALSVAPYLAAFSTQHKDEAFLQAVAGHFPSAAHLRQTSQRKAWITDTYAEVNGVSRTIQALAATAARIGRPLTVLTCLESVPPSKADLKNFPPVGSFPMPEYESQLVSFPPFLEVIEYIERHRFNELIISTPGPMGLTGLAAARLLGLRTTGIYHTDFAQYVRHLTRDDDLADLTWKYMLWFYEQTSTILVPTDFYRQQLIHHGFHPSKLGVMARGVDAQLFDPAKRDPALFDRHGLGDTFRFLYVGRLSREKNLDGLLDAFDELLRRGHKISLAIVGDGPYRRPLETRCQGRPAAFTGLLEGEELARTYASADAMVFPSATDTFGNVVLEAQASGVPVIVTDRGGPADIVRCYDSGIIVDHAQPAALVDAMERLYLSAEHRAELRARGLRNAAESRWEDVLEGFWTREAQDLKEADLSAYRSPDPHSTAGMIEMDLA
jgi:glycosyltransferase involved in cell wall biosynthesis